MHGVTVRRWRRYGKDRLYVAGQTGNDLGWYDLLAGVAHPATPESRYELEAIVQAWRLDSRIGSGQSTIGRISEPETAANPTADRAIPEQLPPSVSATPEVPDGLTDAVPEPFPRQDSGSKAFRPTPVMPPRGDWEDLAQRSAGASAREVAIARRDAAPVRTFAARILGVHTEERAWRIGADGEEKVGARLAKLTKKDPRWRVLHAIPVGERGSDIDHVVVGPGGAYTLNAKHHPGAKIWVAENTFMINGRRHPYIRNARHEADRASRLLSARCGFPVSVSGVVVPVGADDLVIKSEPRDVFVVNRMSLARWLARRPEVLTEAAITTIFEFARRSTTWVDPG